MKKALILGGSGFLGGHLSDVLKSEYKVYAASRRCGNLMCKSDTHDLYRDVMPDVIFYLAAYVGGIGLNQKDPSGMIYKNLQMGINVIEGFKDLSEEYENIGREKPKLINVGTVCSYPKHAKTPFSEGNIWDGYPEETNAPYGIAKRAIMTMSKAYSDQYGLRIAFAIPSNLYGPHDNFDLENSHVIPAIMRKCKEAKEKCQERVFLWGTGIPTREFLYVKDCACALKFIAENVETPNPINISSNCTISINNLANKIKDIVGYKGKIVWDTTKPDGQLVREVSNERLLNAGCNIDWSSLDDGLRETFRWYSGK